jgi:hypothetical protein
MSLGNLSPGMVRLAKARPPRLLRLAREARKGALVEHVRE